MSQLMRCPLTIDDFLVVSLKGGEWAACIYSQPRLAFVVITIRLFDASTQERYSGLDFNASAPTEEEKLSGVVVNHVRGG